MAFDFNHETLRLISDRFKTLGEPMRLELLHALKGGERTVSELVEQTGAGQANVSKHLGLLHRYGWVERRKNGLNVYYRIADPLVFQLCELVCSSIDAEVEARRKAIRGAS
jgi:DNA-binding transcriptional ArsR family regulator